MAALPQVVIIGGGFAGLAAARRLRNVPCEVTIVDRHNHHVFQPLLYQVATAGLSPGDIASPIRWILRKQARLRVLLANVERIDTGAKQLWLDQGERLGYDYLIVAAGSTHSYFGHDEWSTVAPGLKTLDDALAIRRRLLLSFEEAEREPNPVYQRRLLTFVIIGGGPTGVEMAGALGEIARHVLRTEFDNVDPAIARIFLIEAGPSILPAFPEPLRESARIALLRLGITVRLGKAVTKVEPEAVWIGDERIDAHTIVWAAGVAAASISRDLGPNLDRAGRVIVDADLSVPGHPGVFVAGDLASFSHQTGKPLPGVAQVAKQQGVARGGERRQPHRPTPDVTVSLLRPRQHGDHRPQRRNRRLRLPARVGLPRLAVVALRPHPVPHRVSESHVGTAAVGGGVSHLSAQREANHEGSIRVEFVSCPASGGASS